MARSESQKNADKVYRQKAKTQKFQVSISKDEIFAINEFCENVCKPIGVSKARFVAWACLYFIERGELPPPSEVVPTADGESGEDGEDSTNNSGDK